jgi:hypothetical protein
MDILISRQPIFDFNRGLFAYELAMARIGVAGKDVYEIYLQSLGFIPFLNQDVHEEKSEPRRSSTASTVRSGVVHSTK